MPRELSLPRILLQPNEGLADEPAADASPVGSAMAGRMRQRLVEGAFESARNEHPLPGHLGNCLNWLASGTPGDEFS